MTFKITIETDNAAFESDLRGEVVRILNKTILELEACHTATEGDLIDYNGNVVGEWVLSDDEDLYPLGWGMDIYRGDDCGW